MVTEQKATLRRERKRTDNFFLIPQYSERMLLAGTQSNKILLYAIERYFFHPSLYFFSNFLPTTTQIYSIILSALHPLHL